MNVLRSIGAPQSPARVQPPQRAPLRVAAVQERWYPDAAEHRERLAHAVALAAAERAQLVCLQELTLSPYFAVSASGPGAGAAAPEPVPGGQTAKLVSALAREHGLSFAPYPGPKLRAKRRL